MLTTGKAAGVLSVFVLIATLQASEVCGQSSVPASRRAARGGDNL